MTNTKLQTEAVANQLYRGWRYCLNHNACH